MPKKINCKIQIDTSMNDEQLVDALIVEHSISGGMTASQDWEDSYTLRFSLFTTPMKAWNKLHRIAQSLAREQTEYIVSVWEDGMA